MAYLNQFYQTPPIAGSQQVAGAPMYQQPQIMPTTNLTCAYVQGEEAAKSYPVGPGQLAVLLDIEKNVIYTKTTDQFGRPLPITILDYTKRQQTIEQTPSNTSSSNYVTKDELDKFGSQLIDNMKELLRQNRPNPSNFNKRQKEEQ